jgi:hypothetical protein
LCAIISAIFAERHNIKKYFAANQLKNWQFNLKEKN